MGIITEKIQHREPQYASILEDAGICMPKWFSYFDFGRSSPNKGTFKFKEQWGAEPHALNWMLYPRATIGS